MFCKYSTKCFLVKAFKKIFWSSSRSPKIFVYNALVEIIILTFSFFNIEENVEMINSKFSSRMSSSECNIIRIGFFVELTNCWNLTDNVVILGFIVISYFV